MCCSIKWRIWCNNVYAGVPVIIGKDGVEKIEQIDLMIKKKKNLCIL
jgi:malate/lactate dehydrogenase